MENTTEAARPSITLRCAFCLTLNRLDMDRAADRPRCGECRRPFLLDRPLKIGGEDLDTLVAEAGVPVLLDCYADWCGPCKLMAPVLDEFAARHVGQVLVAKLDTDAHPAAASRLGIRAIPTLIVFRDGVESARQAGAASLEGLESLLAAK